MSKHIDFTPPPADKRQHDQELDARPLIQHDSPFLLFKQWYEMAEKTEPADPNAMSVATSDSDGMPNIRMVLMKGFDERGFVFYTNTQSKKGQEIAENPQVALCFHWKSQLKQVRIQGIAEYVDDEEADDYFQSRDFKSRIGAWASKQSQVLESRLELIKQVGYYTARYALGHVDRPPYWTGYRIVPVRIEFWQNGPFRLHDRLVFRRENAHSDWAQFRIYP